MRDNAWLAKQLDILWKNHFADVPLANTIYVRFGRPAKQRLGSIKFGRRKHNPNTFITVTGYFRDPAIPEYVVIGVLAHELTHYTHGFFSPLTQLYKHPHKDGVVDKELTKRGLTDIMVLQKTWLKTKWRGYLETHGKRTLMHFLRHW